MKPRATISSSRSVRAWFSFSGSAAAGLWGLGLALFFLKGPGVTTVAAETLVVYSFNQATIGQTGNFSHDFLVSSLSASSLSTHDMDTVGVVTNFVGATDNNGYSNFFDGKGFAARASVLVDEGTAPEPTNNYVEFTLTPYAGRAIAITNVLVDFGLDDATPNAVATQARYDLYLSLDGTNFTRIGATFSQSNVGKTYPGYTIRNDVAKPVTGFSALTNSITFRLAFADSNSSNALKRVFFDDIEVQGELETAVELHVDDAIAWEPEPDLWAQFSISRSATNDPLWVNFALTDHNLTNGAATRGVDYTASAVSPVLFGAGESTRKVRIHPIDDRETEPPESITLTLLPGTNYIVTGPSNGVAVLYDDEQPSMPVCFSDDFNSEASSNNWKKVTAQRFGASEEPIIDFAYDYSADGIPPAPGSTDTLGLKIGFTNAVGSAPAVVNLFHSETNWVTDKYVLSFYAYLQFDQSNSIPQHALAGINADPAKTNYIYRSGGGFVISGDAQFVTLVGNNATNTSIARAHLWDPTVSTNALDNFPPGPTANQLLNNPPYGANGGSPGVLGCDVASSHKTWLHCQLIQLGNLVRLRINGYLVLEATITNNQPNGIVAPALAPGSLSYGAIMLGYLNEYSVNSTNNFVVFDNVSVSDLNAIAITSLAVVDPDIALNFYSRLSASNDPAEFKVLRSIDGPDDFQLFTSPAPELMRISVPDSEGYYGAYFYNEFTPEADASKFYEMRWSTNSP